MRCIYIYTEDCYLEQRFIHDSCTPAVIANSRVFDHCPPANWPWFSWNSAAVRPVSDSGQIVVKFRLIWSQNPVWFWLQSCRSPTGVKFWLNHGQILADLEQKSRVISVAIAPAIAARNYIEFQSNRSGIPTAIRPKSWRITPTSGAATSDRNHVEFQLNHSQNLPTVGSDSNVDPTAIEIQSNRDRQ